MGKEQLVDGSLIEENFDTLEEVKAYVQDSEHTRVDFSKMKL